VYTLKLVCTDVEKTIVELLPLQLEPFKTFAYDTQIFLFFGALEVFVACQQENMKI